MSQKHLLLLCLWLVSSIAAINVQQRLTPATKLTMSFDDMLVNSAPDAPKYLSASETKIKTAVSSLTETLQVVSFIRANLLWVKPRSIIAVVDSLRTLAEDQIQNHLLINYSENSQQVHFALLSFMKTSTEYKAVVVVGERAALEEVQSFYHHDRRISNFGLPVSEITILISSGAEMAEFVDQIFAELLLEAKRLRGSNTESGLGFDIMGAINSATGAVKSITDAYSSIVSAFKIVKSKTFKEKINGEGFKNYRSRSRFIRSLGIPITKWAQYKSNYFQLMKLSENPNIRKDINALLTMANFIPDNSWNFNDMTFQTGKGGTCDSVVAMTRNDMLEAVVHVVTVVANATFNLADDVLIYENYKSVAGGIVEKTKTTMKNVARTLTADEAKAINALVLVHALEVLANNFGVKWSIPEKLV